MALTTEQQQTVDVAIAIETSRASGQAAAEASRARLEAVRLAKEVLIENARNKPVDSRDVTAADITAFAATLITYINT
jgi:hypothetical protein